jgi:tripartite-type tricarboxylate transporter receptor subunit TctC
MEGTMPKPPRRQFLHLAAGAAALATLSRIARAQAYPTQPLRWIIGFPPGGGADIVARIMAPWLSERLGQPVIIENRPGASTNIAVQAVVNSPPDGYTLLFLGASAVVNASLFESLPFNLQRDIAPVSGLIDFPMVMVAHPSVPAKTVAELIAYAKANPRKISMASFGTGSASHLAGELFKMMAGVDLVHVPYRGSYWADLLGGQVQVAFAPIPSSTGYIQAGTLRALAVTSATRLDAMPDLPTVREFVPGYEAIGWYGVGAPKSTPAEIIDKLNNEIKAALADPTIKARFADLGGTRMPGSPADFGRFIADETEKWAKVVKFAGIKPE